MLCKNGNVNKLLSCLVLSNYMAVSEGRYYK